MFKLISRSILGVLAVACLTLALVNTEACKAGVVGPQNLGALAATSSNISYQVNGGATLNLASSAYPPSLPPNTSVVIALQSNAGVYKTTFTLDCPGYLTSPQQFVILSNDGGNTSNFTFTTPNLVPARCTVTTQTYDGVSSFSNSVNQFSIGTFGVIEVPIQSGASTNTVASTSLLPAGSVVTGSYFAVTGATWDAGITITAGPPVDAGATPPSNYGYWDSGTTLQAIGTFSAARNRYYAEGGAMPIQVNLTYASGWDGGAGSGVVGIEYATPGN